MKYSAFTLTANGKLNQIKTEVIVQANGNRCKINAIWDTGASGTCISKKVAQHLNLKPVVSYRLPPDAFHIDYVAVQKPDKKGRLIKEQLKKKQV